MYHSAEVQSHGPMAATTCSRYVGIEAASDVNSYQLTTPCRAFPYSLSFPLQRRCRHRLWRQRRRQRRLQKENVCLPQAGSPDSSALSTTSALYFRARKSTTSCNRRRSRRCQRGQRREKSQRKHDGCERPPPGDESGRSRALKL
jgi:hypothetical protein